MRAWVGLRGSLALAAGACVAALAGAAGAAVIVVGGGAAETCSEAAEGGSSTSFDVRACTTALTEEQLDDRARAATHVNRGVLHMRRGERAEALADFDRAIGMGEHLGEAYVNRGALLILERRYAEGLADTNRALDLALREPEKAWFNRAIAHEELGDTRSAYLAYRRASELDPGWGEPRTELARFSVRSVG